MGYGNVIADVLTYPFTKIAANGQGDLQRALGRGVMSHIQLIKDVDAAGNNANCINVMAKYKPFRSTTTFFATDAARTTARKNARFGLSTAPPNFYPNAEQPPAWSYLKPDGDTYPLRALDFIKDTSASQTSGYDSQAVQPIALDMPSGLMIANAFPMMIYKDGGVNNLPGSLAHGRWFSDRSLSINDILANGVDYSGHFITFVFYDLTSASVSTDAPAVVVTRYTFGSLSGEVSSIILWPQGDGTQAGDHIEGGIHFPQIPMLKDSGRIGHNFRVALCLSSGGPDSGYEYQVKANNAAYYSLGFDANNRLDLFNTKATSFYDVDYLSGTINTGNSLSKVGSYDATFDTWSIGGNSGKITSLVSSDANWALDEISGKYVDVDVTFTNQYGIVGTGTPYQGQMTFTTTGSIFVPKGQNIDLAKDLVSTSGINVYFPKSLSADYRKVLVTAKFRLGGNEKSFSNSVTIQ